MRSEVVLLPQVHDYRLQGVHGSFAGGAWCKEQLFLYDAFPVGEIHGKYPKSSGRSVGEGNSGGIGVYDFAYVRRNRAHYFPQIQTGRDAARQIQEQLKPLVPGLKCRFCAHMQSAANDCRT
jgi:hypothetical protein